VEQAGEIKYRLQGFNGTGYDRNLEMRLRGSGRVLREVWKETRIVKARKQTACLDNLCLKRAVGWWSRILRLYFF
jgi:hypothetical protein